MTCRNGKSCDVQSEQVHEPHLNNTHTLTLNMITHYTCVVLRVQDSQGIQMFCLIEINFIDCFVNFCVLKLQVVALRL